MSPSSNAVAQGSVSSQRSANPAAPQGIHLPQFAYSLDDPVNRRMQNLGYVAGTPLFTRNPDAKRILAAATELINMSPTPTPRTST
ncbi:hypothetical protein BKA56DRAFT_675581 [Ilyonectria sp. MPI-CAGE-AT-0026]|nr:hypothetical protein BKA56DRAFT_675581 [Ilyonectria sp. MPI-CAGE-AT-0026]